mgnify:CR=1 FL=1
MDLQSLVAACATAFVFCKFVLEPIATSSARKKLLAGRKAGLGTVAVLQLSSRIAFLATVSALAACGLAYWLGSQSDLGLTETNQFLARVDEAQALLSKVGTGWGLTVSIVCVLGLLLIAFSQSRSREKKILKEAWNRELERLQAQMDAGEWEELEPSPEMRRIEQVMQELAAEFDRANAANDRAQINPLKQSFQKLADLRLFLDAQRRAETSVDPALAGISSNQGVISKIRSIFFSKGVVSSLNAGSKFIIALGLLILFPSLLVASYQAGDAEIQSAIDDIEAHKAQLEFEIEFANLAREYTEIAGTVRQTEDEFELRDDLDAAVAETAEIFEQDIFPRVVARSLVASGSNLDAVASGSERVRARGAILDIRARNASGAQAWVSGGSDLPDLNSLSQHPTPVRERAARDLSQIARNNPEAFERIRQNAASVRSSFSTPASANQLRRALVSQVVGHAFDAAPSIEGLDPALDRQIRSWAGSISGDEAAKAYNAVFQKFAIESVKSDGRAGAWSSIESWNHQPLSANTRSNLSSSLDAFDRSLPSRASLAEVQPGLSRASTYNAAQAEAAAARMAARIGRGGNTAFVANALTSFDDHFPGQRGADLETSRARTARTLSGSPPASAARAPASASHVRARSYARLRGFARIGGVLIGREPETDDEHIELSEFEWRRSGDRIGLSVGNDGQLDQIGSFDPAIVNVALAYAADGRPTTVTMVTADPVPDLRILLHPVLEDTGLGCRAIRLDQLADEYSGNEGTALNRMRAERVARIHAEFGLYKFAWLARAKKKLSSASLSGSDRTYAEELVDSASYIAEQAEADALVAQIEGSLLIRRKPEFFDESLVSKMEACLPSRATSTFSACIADRTLSQGGYSDDFSWLAPAPDYQIWSGVRELSYDLDPELSFLDTSGQSEVWPFRFMVQVAFESPAYFAGGASRWADDYNIARDDYIDADPWELEDVSNAITSAISGGLGSNQDTKQVISSMREFAILQRFFRNALDGRFGDQFPVSKLVDLAEVTASDLNSDVVTARWLRRTGQIEQRLYFQIESAFEQLSSPYQQERLIDEVGSCVELIASTVEDSSLGETALENISDDAWNSVCVFSGITSLNPALKELEQFSEYIAEVRNLRSAVGATVPQRQEHPTASGYCPAL